MPNINVSIPTPTNMNIISVPDKKALFIVGRNGTGKSALVHFINQNLRHQTAGGVVYLPGSRPTYFDADSLNMTAASRTQYDANVQSWDASPDNRFRPIAGTSRNERAIYDLQAAELQYRVQAAYDIEAEGVISAAIARLQSKSSPIDRVNRLLVQANLPVQMVISSGELKAKRNDNIYSISKMSDGERTALIFIAEVIAGKPGCVFIVDEPELHLHRAIVVPLLTALLNDRPDCNFVVSTHELALPSEHPDNPIVLVRGCIWQNGVTTSWQVDILASSEAVPEDLRVDLLGSRKTILFVEGVETSRDTPMYSALFPKASVRHRASCNDVRRAVVGLRQIQGVHHANAIGLVDNDSMDNIREQELLSEGVYALPVHSVESLYYASETVAAVAERHGKTLNEDPAILVAEARSKALAKLSEAGKVEHLAARVAEQRLRDKILSSIPDRHTMVASGTNPMNVTFESPYPDELIRLQSMLQNGDLDGIIAGFPIRESGVLGVIARELHFLGEVDYEKAALAAVSTDPALEATLKLKLGNLAAELE